MSIWGITGKQRAAATVPALDADWFPEQRAFYDDPALLLAVIKGRRAGGSFACCGHFVRTAVNQPGSSLLYLNSTRPEAEKIAWYGPKNDGMASLVKKYKIPCKPDASRLTLRFDNGSFIQLAGADDEAELRKRLGYPYTEVLWDEAQKIPPKLGPSIREVLLPSLLDYKGRFRMVGTPVRQMSGMFFDVTNPDLTKRLPGWKVFHWNLLANPFFGATQEERWQNGILGLQNYYGGVEAAPIDSPIMQREAFGRWVREDAAYVYYVHKRNDLLYAPHRGEAGRFPDIRAALGDMPWPWQQGFYALGVDIGYSPDPFAFCLVGWHPNDPVLYEVASWRKTHLTSDEQAAAMRAVRDVVPLGFIVADAGGPAKPTVAGWSTQFIERYGLPVLEAEKHNKHDAIATGNTDIVAGHARFRDGSPLYEDMSTLQWSHLVSGSGRLVEDPTMSNHNSDAWLYASRHARQYRAVPAPSKLSREERLAKEQAEIEEDLWS